MQVRKNIQSVYQKMLVKKHVDLLLIGEEGKRNFIKDFTTFMYDHTLHLGRKHFCCYCLKLSVQKKY